MFFAMNGIRLGHWRRAILLAVADGAVQISAGARTSSERQSRWRAARALEDLGLVRLERRHARRNDGGRHRQLLVAHATELGRAVLQAFRDALERGRRIRWDRFASRVPAWEIEG